MQNAENQRAFDHLVEGLFDPQTSESNQVKFNAERLQKVKDCFKLRPHFLPIVIDLPAEVQNLPIAGVSNEARYDLIITGAITDGEDKQINFHRDIESQTAFVSNGTSAGAKISLNAVAGKSLETSGMNGIQSLSPFLLRAGEEITVEITKPVATANAEKVNICFVGYRVFSPNFIKDNFTAAIETQVLNWIERRPTPEPRFAVCPVVFDADGNALAETPKANEPRLILGFRSTFSNALVNLGFDRESTFSRDFFPIWALAAEDGDKKENYRMLKSPIFIEANQQLYFTLKNTIDGVNYAENGKQIEVLEQTV